MFHMPSELNPLFNFAVVRFNVGGGQVVRVFRERERTTTCFLFFSVVNEIKIVHLYKFFVIQTEKKETGDFWC